MVASSDLIERLVDIDRAELRTIVMVGDCLKAKAAALADGDLDPCLVFSFRHCLDPLSCCVQVERTRRLARRKVL